MIYLRSSGAEATPLKWTATGRVQIRRTVVYGNVMPALLGVFEAVPCTDLAHSDGTKMLARTLATLPREPLS